jgi:hypothetical protein
LVKENARVRGELDLKISDWKRLGQDVTDLAENLAITNETAIAVTHQLDSVIYNDNRLLDELLSQTQTSDFELLQKEEIIQAHLSKIEQVEVQNDCLRLLIEQTNKDMDDRVKAKGRAQEQALRDLMTAEEKTKQIEQDIRAAEKNYYTEIDT